MNTRLLILVFLLLGLAKQEVHSQFGFSHEIGVIAGPVVFYSDFGQRYDFETNSGNVGFGVGLIHYITFLIVQTVTVTHVTLTSTITSNFVTK